MIYISYSESQPRVNQKKYSCLSWCVSRPQIPCLCLVWRNDNSFSLNWNINYIVFTARATCTHHALTFRRQQTQQTAQSSSTTLDELVLYSTKLWTWLVTVNGKNILQPMNSETNFDLMTLEQQRSYHPLVLLSQKLIPRLHQSNRQ